MYSIYGMKFVVKDRSVLGDYICLHGLLPKNEMPKRLRKKIPKNEIWVRKDVWLSSKRTPLVIHEKTELNYMKNYGLSYKEAHRIAEIADGAW